MSLVTLQCPSKSEDNLCFGLYVHCPSATCRLPVVSVEGITDLRATRYSQPLVKKDPLEARVHMPRHFTRLGHTWCDTPALCTLEPGGTRGLPSCLHCVLPRRLSSGTPGPTCARISCSPGRRGRCPAGRRTAPATPDPGCAS